MKSHPNSTEQNAFIVKIFDFYSTLAKEMISRLPLTGIFTEFEFNSPEFAFCKSRQKLNSLPMLSSKFKHLIEVIYVYDEWRVLPYAFDDDEVSVPINKIAN